MKKDKIMIFPYDSNFTPFLRWRPFIDSYKNISLCSFSGWGLCGKDAGNADEGNDTGLLVEQDFENALKSCDTVVFVESDNYVEPDTMIYPKIDQAIDYGKNIICLMDLGERAKQFKEKCEKQSLSFYEYKSDENKKIYDFNQVYGLYNIDTPIISLIGSGEGVNKFNIQLDLKTRFEEIGYRVSLIASKKFCDIFGIHSFPQFMFDCNISEVIKVFLLNSYIKHIETEEKPDIIILGVPGGFTSFNNKIHNYFGITAFEVFQSIISDVIIASIYQENNLNDEFITKINNLVKYRFGFDIDAINVSNKQIDWVEMTNARPNKVRCVSLSPSTVDKRISKIKIESTIPIFNSLDPNYINRLAELIICKLSRHEPLLSF